MARSEAKKAHRLESAKGLVVQESDEFSGDMEMFTEALIRGDEARKMLGNSAYILIETVSLSNRKNVRTIVRSVARSSMKLTSSTSRSFAC